MIESPDLKAGLKALDDAAEVYEEALEYYEGTLPERFATEAMRRILSTGPGRYRFRYAHLPVNAVKNRCQIAAVRAESEEVTRAIELMREDNRLETFEPWMTERLLVLGDAYLMAWPIEDEDGVRVEVSYQSPLQCRAIYSDEAGRDLEYVVRRWAEDDKTTMAEVWYVDGVEVWIKAEDDPEWMPYAEDDLGERVPVTEDNWPIVHEWGEIPIKHGRTALPYGRPEHINAYGPQDAITKAVTTQVEADLEAHGWPERYRIADDNRALDMAQDAVQWADDTDENNDRATRADGTARGTETARRRGAGREHVYTGTKAVGTFEPPNPGDLIAPVQQWIEMMSTVTETPLYELDPKSGMQLSGVSREKADRPLAAKVDARRQALDTLWCQELWPLALRMAGVRADSPAEIVWKPPPVNSDPEWWATAQARANMGVPISVILAEANYAPEDVDEWLDDQAEDASLDQRIARVKALGEAMAQLGTGITLGVISPEGAQALLKRIMKEAAETSSQDVFPDEEDLEPDPAPIEERPLLSAEPVDDSTR